MIEAMQEAIVRVAHEVAGMNCSEHLDDFTDLLLPVCVGTSRDALRNTLALPFGHGGISTCALVNSAIQYRAGFAISDLAQTYVWGEAVTRSEKVLKDRGLWLAPTASNQPDAGNTVVIGGPDESWGGMEHVFTVTGWDGPILTSVDGGLVDDKGLQAIGPVRRRWVQASGATWVWKEFEDTGRRVQGFGGPHEAVSVISIPIPGLPGGVGLGQLAAFFAGAAAGAGGAYLVYKRFGRR